MKNGPDPSFSSDFTSLSSISLDSNLSQLRGQIKKVMIPLLIQIFELKLAAQQAKSPPSRLHTVSQEPLDEIASKLNHLDGDLKLLSLWCTSCQKQIARALKEVEGSFEQPPTPPARFSSTTAPREAVSPTWFQKFLGKQ